MVIHYVYLAVAGGRVAYVGMGKRDRHYDRIYMHMRGHSSAAKRGLGADVFVVVAYTRNKRLAEMWESWLPAVFSPPYAERSPRKPPRKPPLFPRARRRDKPVEEPVAMAKYAKLVGASPAGASAPLAEVLCGGCSENHVAVVHADKPPPPSATRRLREEDCQFHVWRCV